MNGIFINVYNSNGELEEGPVIVQSAKIVRTLDSAGSISIATTLSEQRARELFKPNRRVDIWIDRYDTLRLVGSGFIRNIKKGMSVGGYVLQCEGPDLIGSLDRHTSTLNAILVGDFNSAASTILGSAGWIASVSGSWGDVSLEIDVESILTTVINLINSVGNHFRIGSNSTTLDIGSFGNDSGILATNQVIASDEVLENNEVILITDIEVISDSEQMINYLIPIGKGVGTEPLTLEFATVPGIFSTVDAFGKTIYYIKDQVSIDNEGLSELTRAFRNIVPLSDSPTDIENAANALYFAAKAWMDKHQVPQETYRIRTTKTQQNIKPGDTIKVFYDGFIEVDGQVQELLHVDEILYIMKVTENLNEEDSLELEVSSIDRVTITPERAISRSVQSSQWSEKELMKAQTSGGGGGGSGFTITPDTGLVVNIPDGGDVDIVGGDGIETTGSSGQLSIGVVDGGITTAKIAALAVDGSKIASNAISQSKIDDNAVGTNELIDDNVTLAKLAHGTPDYFIGFDGSGIPVEKPGASGGIVDVQVFTSNGTWNKPANAKAVKVICIGAGGGGGGGRSGLASTHRQGGTGGGGGMRMEKFFDANALASSEPVVVGAGGTGGAGGTNANGSSASAGTESTFSAAQTLVFAGGGGGGLGGTAINPIGIAGGGGAYSSGTGTTRGEPNLAAAAGFANATGTSRTENAGSDGGGASQLQAGGQGGNSLFGGPGGGGGGCVTNGNVQNVGGSGGVKNYVTPGTGSGGAVNGGAGADGTSYGNGITGTGGAGGGANVATGLGGDGGNGGFPGGGGGGGGASRHLSGTGTGGAGGDGGDGEVIVITWS